MTVTSHKKWTQLSSRTAKLRRRVQTVTKFCTKSVTSYYNSISAQSQARQTARPQESAPPQQSWVRRYADQLLGFIGRKSHSAP